MKCPACAKEATNDSLECPSCGVVFAKWKQLEEKKAAELKRTAEEALATLESGTAHEDESFRLDPWLGRKIAAAFVAAWIIGFGLYLRHQNAHRRVPSGEPSEEFAEVRDPQTGEIRRLLIRRVDVGSAHRP